MYRYGVFAALYLCCTNITKLLLDSKLSQAIPESGPPPPPGVSQVRKNKSKKSENPLFQTPERLLSS